MKRSRNFLQKRNNIHVATKRLRIVVAASSKKANKDTIFAIVAKTRNSALKTVIKVENARTRTLWINQINRFVVTVNFRSPQLMSSKLLKCECGYSTEYSSNLERHKKSRSHLRFVQTGSIKKTFKCEICGHTSNNRANHNRHTKAHGARELVHRWKCLACDESMKGMKQVGLHMATQSHIRNVVVKFPNLVDEKKVPIQDKWTEYMKEIESVIAQKN